jgi:hypothetical protein
VKDQKRWLQPLAVMAKSWFMREKLEKCLQNISKIGEEVTRHIVSLDIPRMQTKLDDLSRQATVTGTELSQKMDELLSHTRQLHAGQQSNSALIQAMEKWRIDQRLRKMQVMCLRALYYSDLHSREDNVKEAHRQTFEWIFEDKKHAEEDSRPSETRFRDWLRSSDAENDIFWVSGKLGAGKSPLMKFMARHASLKEHIENWVGSRRFMMIEHFFWRPGSHLQRSLVGFLRSLLYQILKEAPHLISLAFPASNEWMIDGEKYRFRQSVLLEALKTVARVIHANGLCLLVFVDSLDEYNEHDENADEVWSWTELNKVLRDFHHSPGVKLCVSSRPEPLSEKEFGGDKSRCTPVHESTRKDIETYIGDILANHKNFKKLVQRALKCTTLVEELIEHAKGVFLWIHLATHDLLDGIRNDDRFSDLQKRLRKLPKKQEAFMTTS